MIHELNQKIDMREMEGKHKGGTTQGKGDGSNKGKGRQGMRMQ